MELCPGGTLRNLLDREGHELSRSHAEPRVWEMTTHIARGLSHIHSYKVRARHHHCRNFD
jgi:serine/threonine protein kinase